MPDAESPIALIVGGVCGAGKTTVARKFAALHDCPFLDADDVHPPENVRKMSAGVALSDDDREPWLDAVGAWIVSEMRRGLCVVACSALRRRYRDRLRGAVAQTQGSGGPRCAFALLHGDTALLRQRLAARTGHFMPAGLLSSQLATLELPTAEEPDAVTLDVAPSPEEICGRLDEFVAACRHSAALEDGP